MPIENWKHFLKTTFFTNDFEWFLSTNPVPIALWQAFIACFYVDEIYTNIFFRNCTEIEDNESVMSRYLWLTSSFLSHCLFFHVSFVVQVIFSQSSDTLDHQPSVGGSSGEETSLPEASSSECHNLFLILKKSDSNYVLSKKRHCIASGL